jgi:hypothetical protein
MKAQQRIWKYLLKNNTTSNLKIEIRTEVNIKSIKPYVKALFDAGYIIRCIYSKRFFNKDTFKLIKYTGDKAPIFSNGFLRDVNTQEEIKSSNYKRDIDTQKELILTNLIDSLVELNKDKILVSELAKIVKEKSKNINNLKTFCYGSGLKKWLDKLEKEEAIKFTGERFRNSKIFTVNLSKIKTIKDELKNLKDHNFVFRV